MGDSAANIIAITIKLMHSFFGCHFNKDNINNFYWILSSKIIT